MSKTQKTAVVCGGGGFIGGHLIKKLKNEGYWVRGVDIKEPYGPTKADEFLLLDLRESENCRKAMGGKIEEVYQLAADMGGMGFIVAKECDLLINSNRINMNMISEAADMKIPKYFFSSTVCVYRNMEIGEASLNEENAYPAFPDSEYGWEKLFAERVLQTFDRNNKLDARIARFQNCYGPEGAWDDNGRAKAPADISRKVALAKDGEQVEVWGDGKTVRSFIYVDDLVEGIYKIMNSNEKGPFNIGTDQYVSVDELVNTVIKVSGKNLSIKHVDKGYQGVRSRNFSNEKLYALGWKPKYSLEEGLRMTYPWIAEKVKEKYSAK